MAVIVAQGPSRRAWLAAVTATLATGVALVLAFSLRRQSGPLQRLAVVFAFDGVDDAERHAFMKHFDLTMQRGGG